MFNKSNYRKPTKLDYLLSQNFISGSSSPGLASQANRKYSENVNFEDDTKSTVQNELNFTRKKATLAPVKSQQILKLNKFYELMAAENAKEAEANEKPLVKVQNSNPQRTARNLTYLRSLI